jgi:hypothetical protein
MGKVISIPEDRAVLIQTLLPKSLLARLQEQAAVEGRPAGEILAEALQEKLVKEHSGR